MLKVKILEKKGPVLKFLVEDIDTSLANSLRRIMITDIPTLAVQWIDVHDNNSALFDEVISHRLGLVPLKFNAKNMNFTEDCTCKGKGCPLCQTVLVLDKKGPCIVTTGDLKSSDKSVAPSDPRFPITELLEKQSLKLEAVARLGTGASHAKHQAANASYQYYPKIKVTGTKADADRALKMCPKGSAEVKGNAIEVRNLSDSDTVKSCLFDAKGIEVGNDESRIIFTVESISGLEPEYIVSKAAEILQAKAEDLKKHISKL
ncbi:MAG: DNA-directed RNA polymerase subunit D [Candidatus Aenigmarchaeota archaeon]|nr:DNA-directed RNA polymerase subunit D [Candidatus Aenigmarchaeota archaeon]